MATPTSEQSTYECEDGTDFPVEWPSDDAPNHAWRWNEDHHPGPSPALVAAIEHGRKPGGERAYMEAEVDPPPMFREWLNANGFHFIRMSPLSAAELEGYVARARALAARCGGVGKVWEAHSLPRVQRTCEELRALPAEAPVEEAAFLFDYAFQLTQVAGPTVQFPVLMGLQGLLGAAIGPEGQLLAHEVCQGGANATIASDQAIWEMGKIAEGDPEAAAILVEGEVDGVAALDAHHPFRRAFEGYIETYRWRAETWDPLTLTVGEAPERVLALVRQSIGAPEPMAAVGAASPQRRAEAIARVEAALRDRPELLEQFRSLVAGLEGYVGVREGRALWQLTATGSLRHALLKKGRLLVERGVTKSEGDVFFLLPAEIDAATAGGQTDLRPQVERRRREWKFWKAKRPPHHLGAPVPAGPVPFPLATVSEGPVLRGTPASRGVVTARVRVLHHIDEADSFQPGEVLVCAMTSPPWTPLFAIAAAVVTDSGAALSHPAIAAREYGIPCVVGAKDASRKLQTGEVVTVDGAAGTVTRTQDGSGSLTA